MNYLNTQRIKGAVALTIFNLALLFSVNAQDTHFSQIHASPLGLNPAMTGFFEGQLRFGAIYRNQWFSVASPYGKTKYETMGGYVDASLFKEKLKNDYIGIGAAFTYDKAGDLGLNTMNATLSLAYSKHFGRNVEQSLAIGLQGEFNQKGFNTSGAIFSDGIQEAIGKSKLGLDAGVGLMYHAAFKDRVNMYIGASYTHIVHPNQSFLSNGTDKTYSKISISTGAVMYLSDRFNLLPSFVFLKQGPSIQANLGSYAQYAFSDRSGTNNGIAAGLFARFAAPNIDAVIAAVRLDIKNILFGVSYDINVSDLSKATKGQGAAEISVSYVLNTQKQTHYGKVFCPKF